MGRSRRLGAGVVGASWVVLLSICTEISASSTGYIGSVGGSCVKVARNVAAASCSLTSRLPKAAVPLSLLKTSYGGSQSWRHGDDNNPFMGRLLKNKGIVDDAAGTTAKRNRPKEICFPRSSSTPCLRAVADSSGGSGYSRYGLAWASAQEGERTPDSSEPTGNILKRLSMIAFERSAAAIPQSTISSTQSSLSVLSSDPIKRFSGDSRIGNNEAVGNNQESTSAAPSEKKTTTSKSSALKTFAEADGTPSSSLADRLAAELRPRAFFSGQLHRGHQSGQQQPPRGIELGVQRLNSVIERVEGKLSFDSSEAGQLRVRNNLREAERINRNDRE